MPLFQEPHMKKHMQTSNSGLKRRLSRSSCNAVHNNRKARLILIRLAKLIHEFFDMRSLACQRQWHNTANVHVRAVDVHV